MRPKWAGGTANRPDGPLQSLRRRVWAARVFDISFPDAFEKQFFNGLLGLEKRRAARGAYWALTPEGVALLDRVLRDASQEERAEALRNHRH